MKRWFRSDDHFNNYNVNKYCNRPFIHSVSNNDILINDKKILSCSNNEEAKKQSVNLTVKLMNQTLINNWNSQVSKDDIVYYLGDFAFPCHVEEGKKLLQQLNGKKILILGNHDKSISTMLKMGFDEVYHNLDIMIDNEVIHLSHYPYIDDYVPASWKNPLPQFSPKKELFVKIKKDSLLLEENPIHNILQKLPHSSELQEEISDFFNLNLNPMNEDHRELIGLRKILYNILIGTKLNNDGKILLHGHTHSKIKVNKNMINVCSDAWDYKCVSEDEIIAIIDQIKKQG